MKLLINAVDYSNQLLDGLDNPLQVTLSTVSDNTFEVQSVKPLSRLYWAVDSSHDGTLSLSYFNGTALASASVSSDTTAALTRQGWLTWDRPSDDSKDGDNYRYVFTLEDVSTLPTLNLSFVGIVFSEDRDLKKEYPNIIDHKPENDSSFLRFHVAAKDSIVQWFKGKGQVTFNGTKFQEVDEFDFLIPGELQMASRFMTLAKIFFWLSDSSDDKYYQKGKDFIAESYNSLDVYYVSIDKDQDATPDEAGNLENTVQVLVRG
jgi:hypothetical protein